MLISYNWLRELSGTASTPAELQERLTMVGLAVDSVEQSDDDAVLDVEVPSNRPDCLSHVGIAREVALIERTRVQVPPANEPPVSGKTSDFAAVQIDDPILCPRYAARIVRGVKIGPSPEWLAKRLGAIGQRPINNVADITNYVLHGWGQPLHAFDLAKLSKRQIIVRRATAGERLTTLDGVKRELDPEMLVIADPFVPVALAGIMGGLDSEISNSTIDVLIESAYFDPDSVRRTARKLGMDTEASRRFERGADCENLLRAQALCVELICAIAGGEATEDAIDVYPAPLPSRSVTLRTQRIESLTSLKVEGSEVIRILESLGFVSEASAAGTSSTLNFVVPSWRGDVNLEEDLIEEVARHTGYDQIGSELPASNFSGEYQPAESQRRRLRNALRELGFDEAINFSFIDTAHDDVFEPLPALAQESGSGALVTLDNPILEGVARMRPTLLSGLLESLRHNLNHGIRDVRLFEIGRVFGGFGSGEVSSADPRLPIEREVLALLATGGATEEGLAQATREVDFYDLKGALEAAVDAMNVAPVGAENAEVKHLRVGQAARIVTTERTVIGSIGKLSEPVAGSYKFRQPVFVAELDLSALLEAPQKPVQYRRLPRYPSVVRDVTLLVGRDVAFSELLEAADSEAVPDYNGAKLVGTYEGKNIPENKRSVTLRIEYRSLEGTLRDESVEERHRELVDSLVNKFEAVVH